MSIICEPHSDLVRGQIRSVHTTPFGPLRANWTDAGLRLVEWTETSISWEISGFEQPFEGCEALADRFDEALGAFFEGNFDLMDAISVDCSGWTPFFEKVYRHCREIPAGSTLSYGELATLAGSPRAARAVGQAMATNRLPLVIPCHRVLAAGGKLGGYGGPGGTSTKTWLLENELASLRKPKTQ